jgi:hypothetical protein
MFTTSHSHGAGNPEVGHHGVPALEQDVLGFDIPVYHSTRMCVAQRVSHFAGILQRIVDRKLPFALDSIAQCLTFNQGHDVVQETVSFA